MTNIYNFNDINKNKIQKMTKNIIQKMKNTNNIFVIVIHATWCMHCKTLMEYWDGVKKMFGKISNLYFIDIEEKYINYIKQISIKELKTSNWIEIDIGYPTIRIVKNNLKEIISYNNNINIDLLKNWITENTHQKKNFLRGGADITLGLGETVREQYNNTTTNIKDFMSGINNITGDMDGIVDNAKNRNSAMMIAAVDVIMDTYANKDDQDRMLRKLEKGVKFGSAVLNKISPIIPEIASAGIRSAGEIGETLFRSAVSSGKNAVMAIPGVGVVTALFFTADRLANTFNKITNAAGKFATNIEESVNSLHVGGQRNKCKKYNISDYFIYEYDKKTNRINRIGSINEFNRKNDLMVIKFNIIKKYKKIKKTIKNKNKNKKTIKNKNKKTIKNKNKKTIKNKKQIKNKNKKDKGTQKSVLYK
jgi:thiol-disulfide isomerase/thioredoxin